MRRRAVFADTGYWFALLHPGDQHHARSVEVTAGLGQASIVTTQMVLIEVFNAMAATGAVGRRHITQLLDRLEHDPDVEVIPQTDVQFRAAVKRYASRSDQRWILTDCASFLVMEERNINEALAYDRDFEQAGFSALLR